MRQPLGMKATFILALVVFSAVMSAVFASVSAFRVAGSLREQLEQRGESLTANLVQEAVRILQIEDPDERELSLMLITYRLIGDVIYAQIVQDGRVVSESTLHPEITLDAIRDPAAVPPVRERKIGGYAAVEFVQSLPDETGQSYVRLGLSLANVQENVRRTLLDMFALALIFTATGAIVAFALYLAILKPLERVMASIRRIQAGDHGARAKEEGYTELRELARTFNRMAAVIERRNAELEAVNKELRAANEAKSEFLAMIGHELKTPLHSVRGYCQLLLEEVDGPLTKEQYSDIEAVLGAGNHLLALIDNILHFSAAGTERLHATPVVLPELLRQAANHVKPLAHRKGLTVRVDADGCREVYADETKLKQIVINLLQNAVKYTERGGVKIIARPSEGGGFRIDVCDTGPGVPESERARIFEPFQRIERGGSDDLKGLGLGLAIVQRYVLAHGGNVSVEDAPGGGACFRLHFPAP